MAQPELASLGTKLDRLIWQTDLDQVPRWRAALTQAARLLYAISRDLSTGQLALHAMSLVYTTLLSLVPLLAVSFSVLKGFGVHNQVEPILVQVLSPLGSQSDEIAEQLVGYVDNTNVGVLGSLGLAFLLYSVVSLVSKIEFVFNYTWHVEKQRTFTQRVSQYLSVLLIGPVLFFAALGATASLRSSEVIQKLSAVEPFGLMLDTGAQMLPYVLIVLAFTFAYTFVPNTRVKLGPAVIGALIAGLLWQSLGYVFATFMASSTRYAAIYSGLAIAILFMIWVYIAWSILLIGASIAFYTQFPEFLATRSRDLRLSNRLREQVALCIAAQIASRYQSGQAPFHEEELAKRLRLPVTNVRNILRMLSEAGFVVSTAGDPAGYVPSQAPENIAVSALLSSIRKYGERETAATSPHCSAEVIALQEAIDHTIDDKFATTSLADLALRLRSTANATNATSD
jgi:membrane protein